MSREDHSGQAESTIHQPTVPAELPLTRWRKFRMVVKVVELRLRFIALMAATGLVFALLGHALEPLRQVDPAPGRSRRRRRRGIEYYCPMHPSVVQGEPGICPICGMPLSRRKKSAKSRRCPPASRRAWPWPPSAWRRRASAPRRWRMPRSPRRSRRSATSIRRATAGADRLEAEGHVAGREALRQLHRPVGQGRRAAGRAVQPRAVPGHPGAAHWPSASRRRAAAPQTALGRSVLGDPQDLVRLASEKLRLWGLTQAQIDEILQEGQGRLPDADPRADRRGGGPRRTSSRASTWRKGATCSRSPTWTTSGSRRRSTRTSSRWCGSGRRSRRPSRRSRARPSRGPSRSSTRASTPRPGRSTCATTWRTPTLRLRPGMFATVTPQDPRGGDARLPVAGRRVDQAGRPAVNPSAAEQESLPGDERQARVDGRPAHRRGRGAEGLDLLRGVRAKLKAKPARYLARLAPAPTGRGAHRPGIGGHRHRDPEGRLRRGRARRLRGARGRPRPAVGRPLPGARRALARASRSPRPAPS